MLWQFDLKVPAAVGSRFRVMELLFVSGRPAQFVIERPRTSWMERFTWEGWLAWGGVAKALLLVNMKVNVKVRVNARVVSEIRVIRISLLMREIFCVMRITTLLLRLLELIIAIIPLLHFIVFMIIYDLL